MSEMFGLRTINKPRGGLIPPDARISGVGIRIYGYAPGCVALQLRSDNRYMMVVLERAEVEIMARMLTNAADMLSGEAA